MLAKKLERLKKEKVEMEGASKGEVEQLKAETKEQQETLDAADIERRKMHNVIQVRVGPQVARVGWPESGGPRLLTRTRRMSFTPMRDFFFFFFCFLRRSAGGDKQPGLIGHKGPVRR